MLLHSGFLSKRGAYNKEWKRRWFELLSDRLRYYKTPPPNAIPPISASASSSNDTTAAAASKPSSTNSKPVKAAGEIPLDRLVLEDLPTNDPDYAPSHTTFAVKHPNRTYKLKAESVVEAVQWKEAIFEALRGG